MANKNNKKEEQALRLELLGLLSKNTEANVDYFNHLLFALEVISDELNKFKIEI